LADARGRQTLSLSDELVLPWKYLKLLERRQKPLFQTKCSIQTQCSRFNQPPSVFLIAAFKARGYADASDANFDEGLSRPAELYDIKSSGALAHVGMKDEETLGIPTLRK
jgi:hypothetical protein